MPGAPIMHGYSNQPTSAGEGGAARVAHAGADVFDGWPSHTSFIVWLLLLGVVLPALILGGLKYGGFQFVFKGR